ncbi:MAG: DUF3352 domain-containing protein [Anaerolineaceae bacterium]|nr:MAG: DUF3352 domain-containing protein [Anaerolineaceae bacterium]
MQKHPLRFLLMTILLVVVAGLGTRPAQATDVDDLTANAVYMPVDVGAFLSIRADAEYSDMLGDVLALLNQNTGGMLLPPDLEVPRIRDFAADLLTDIFLVRAGDGDWIGDTISLGVLPSAMPDDPTVLVAISIADRAALEDALIIRTTESDDADFVRFDTPEYDGLISDDVLLLQLNGVADLTAPPANALADNAAFQQARDALPVDSYNIFAYADIFNLIDLAAVNDPELEAIRATMDEGEAIAVAVGATIIDGRTLTLDLVTVPLFPELFMALPNYVEQTPVDPDFAQYLPAYTQLLIHDSDLATDFDAFFAGLDAGFVSLLRQTRVLSDEDPFADFNPFAINFGGLSKTAVNALFAGLTGLNLERDVVSWMTGDYTLAASLIPVDSALTFSFDIALLAEVGDEAAAQAVIDGLVRADRMYGWGGVTDEAGSLSYPDLIASLLSPALGFPRDVINTDELSLMAATDGERFAFGSAPSVRFALNPDGDSLMDNPTYQYATSLFLPDAFSVWYVNGGALADAAGLLAVVADRPSDVEELQFVLAQIESMTISASAGTDGVNITRLTLTLPEEVTLPTPAPAGSPAEQESAFDLSSALGLSN